jgi:NAD(P)-dependent dehydrogenase (short-subunit alcohol dehydrogenase family)
MGKRLEGKVAVVTGGNSGIGEATVKVLAAEGAKVVLMARREAEGQRVEAEVKAAGNEATFIQCDVTSRQSIDAAVAASVERYGRIDILVNNAGGGLPGEFPRESDDVWEATINLNLTSTFRMTRACWNHMAAAGGGSVINMSSVAAVAGTPPAMRELMLFAPPAAYAASKAGIEAFTRYVAGVGAKHNIRVNCVRPGHIETPAVQLADGTHFFQKSFDMVQITPGIGTGEDIAYAVLYLANDESRFVNGQVITVDGGAALKV